MYQPGRNDAKWNNPDKGRQMQLSPVPMRYWFQNPPQIHKIHGCPSIKVLYLHIAYAHLLIYYESSLGCLIQCNYYINNCKLNKCYVSSSVQFSSVAQSCPTLCDPMNCSTPGLPVHHQLPEFTQTHVHRVGDAIQTSHPLSSPSPAPNPSQHQSLFQWVNSLHEVAKVLEFQL